MVRMREETDVKTTEQIKALAELDGFIDFDMLKKQTGDLLRFLHVARRSENSWKEIPNYLTSYDAIIPLIQKQDYHIKQYVFSCIGSVDCVGFNYDPAQLAKALLRATGKWKDE